MSLFRTDRLATVPAGLDGGLEDEEVRLGNLERVEAGGEAVAIARQSQTREHVRVDRATKEKDIHNSF